ncbi:hypothetical protein BDF14DRAFT_980392 [Spinellus fusiger]|nr:hypothetical protein BDF14DRAFT_980392 [Spinellus fusiger]
MNCSKDIYLFQSNDWKQESISDVFVDRSFGFFITMVTPFFFFFFPETECLTVVIFHLLIYSTMLINNTKRINKRRYILLFMPSYSLFIFVLLATVMA